MTGSRKKLLLERQDRWGHGLPLWILVGVAFLLPVVIYPLKDLRLQNDVSGWLPRNDPQARILSWYQGLFPSEDRVLLSWDDCSLTDPRMEQIRETLQGKLDPEGVRKGGSPFIKEVSLPGDIIKKMMKRQKSLKESLAEVEGVLIGRGPMRLRFSDSGRLRGDYLKKEILDLAQSEFGIEVSMVDYSMPMPEGEVDIKDPEGWELQQALIEYVRSEPLYDMQLVWDGMHSDSEKTEQFQKALLNLTDPGSSGATSGEKSIEECFFTPGALAAISISLSEEGIADKKAAIAAIREAVVAAEIDEDAFHMAGQPVVGVALNAAVRDAALHPDRSWIDIAHKSPIILSVLVSVVFSFLMLKSLRLATLVQAVSFLTVLIAVSLVPMSGNKMSMVLIVMPTLLAVLTTSAAIHLSNYWKRSGVSGSSQSVFAAARTAWLPCALAAGTTAIGLASLMTSSLVPVRNFGLYAAIGCGISFVVVLYVLPTFMLYWPKTPPEVSEDSTSHWDSFGRFLARHRWAVCTFCLLITVAAGYGLTNFGTETKIIKYFPTESRLVRDYVFLEDKLSGVISIDTLVRFDRQAQSNLPFPERARMVREIQEEIRAHSEISGVLSLASFLDLREVDRSTMSRLEQIKLRRTQQQMENSIHKRLQDEGGDSESLASMLAIPDYSTDWREAGDQALNREGDEVWRITAQTSALSDSDLEVLIGDMNEIAGRHLAMVDSPHTGHVVTGLIPVFLRTQEAVLESLIYSFGMAFLLIAVVMMIQLRHVGSGFLTMLPNLMPVILIFGAISWFNVKVDIGTMITASVALGIAVDGTLHLITWFKELVSEGMPVEEAVGKSLEHCGPAMWQTSLAIGLGMLALLFADLLLVSRFGMIMFLLIFAALVADVIFLPALLGGMLGRMIRKSCYVPPPPDDAPAQTVRIADPPTPPPESRVNSDGSEPPLKDVV
ncbi:MAG TPA: hypothetical protein DCG12_02320 [Planctomycetaceae bacterium]|nr:hypothetical protein [Planctomycetaceae bacterium]